MISEKDIEKIKKFITNIDNLYNLAEKLANKYKIKDIDINVLPALLNVLRMWEIIFKFELEVNK